MIKYDRRKKYFVTMDVETIGVEKPLVYDLGTQSMTKKAMCL